MNFQQNGDESEKRMVSGWNSVQWKSGIYSCKDREIKPVNNPDNTNINQLSW